MELAEQVGIPAQFAIAVQAVQAVSWPDVQDPRTKVPVGHGEQGVHAVAPNVALYVPVVQVGQVLWPGTL